MKTCRNCGAYHKFDTCPVCKGCYYYMSRRSYDPNIDNKPIKKKYINKKTIIKQEKKIPIIYIQEIIQEKQTKQIQEIKTKKKKQTKTSIKNISRKLARELKKDITECEKCGAGGKLQVHHIDRNALNNSIENLLKICLLCHIEEHLDEPVCRIMKKTLKELQ